MKKTIILAFALAVSATAFAQNKQLDIIGSDNASWDDVDIYTPSRTYEGSNWYNSPIIPNYAYSGIQILYTADKLTAMTGKSIQALTFKYYNEYPADYTSTVKVYLSEADAVEVEYDDVQRAYRWFDFDRTAEPNGEATFVLDIDNFYMTSEFTVQLTTPYTYNGKGLVVTVVNEAGEYGYTDQSYGYFAFHSYLDDWKDESTSTRYQRMITYCDDSTGFFSELDRNNIIDEDAYELMDCELPVVRIDYADNGAVQEVAAAKAVQAVGVGGAIRVTAGSATRMAVYNLAGQLVADASVAEGVSEIPVSAGVYVVKADGAATKVVVY